MRVAKLEDAPLRLLRDRVPATWLAQGLAQGGEGDVFVFGHERLVPLGPHHEYHGTECEVLLPEEWRLVVFDLPFLREHVLVKRARRAPNIDLLVAAEDGLRAFERALWDEIYLDALAGRRAGKLI